MQLLVRISVIFFISQSTYISALHPLLNPFNWYKRIKKACTSQVSSENVKGQHDLLLKLYQARTEVEQLNKIYTATQVKPRYGYWKKPPVNESQKRDAIMLQKRFKEMQKTGIYPLISSQYSTIANLPEYKKKLAAKIEIFEQSLNVKPTGHTVSWHQQLMSQIQPLSKTKARELAKIRKKEFKEWQQSYRRSKEKKIPENAVA